MKLPALLVVLFFVISCSETRQIERDLNALNDRLINYLNLEDNSFTPEIRLNIPPRSSTRIEIPNIQINIREFYALDECQLTKIVAERNTAMGKTQLPSVRFLYEKHLLTLLQSCLEQIGDEHSMSTKLNTWIEQKKENLSYVWVNMITQSTETYTAFGVSGEFISGTQADKFPETKLALNAIRQSLTPEFTATEQLETHLQTLESSRLPARMWRTQKLLNQDLNHMSKILTDFLDNNTCKTPDEKEQVKIMRNIFRMFFAEKIQPLASELNRYHYQLKPIFEEIISNSAIPDQFQRFVNMQITKEHDDYKMAMAEHIKKWQSIFALCE